MHGRIAAAAAAQLACGRQPRPMMRRHRGAASGLQVRLAAAGVAFSLLAAAPAAADFVYDSFNDTAGLRFNGCAGTSSCARRDEYAYSVLYGVNDAPDRGGGGGGGSPIALAEGTATVTAEGYATVTAEDSLRTARHLAAFPHRDASAPAPDGSLCDVRLRLTPARAHQAGSVMRSEPVPVLNGFEAGFTYQVTDHSRRCTTVKDRAFGTASHHSCAVAGGDGFAFVVHGDPSGAAALGGGGGGLGFAGLANALAVEFDTWYNAGDGGGGGGGGGGNSSSSSSSSSSSWAADVLPYDHVAVYGAPRNATTGASAPVAPAPACQLGQARRTAVGDGLVHTARIVYWRYLRYDLLPYFSGSDGLLPFLLDGGEGRRVGTLAVYVDGGGAPLLALPLNLNAVLRLPESLATVGLTASTGASWEKHDILSWYFCETPGCGREPEPVAG